MKKISLLLLVLLLFLTACGGENEEAESADKDETDTHKVSNGKITNNSLLINLAVRAETIVEKYDEIDNVTVDEDNIKAIKTSDQKDEETGDIYKNVYSITGQYSWKDKRYNFEWVVSFEENNVEAGGNVLQYTSDMGVNQLNVKRSAVE